MKILLRKVSQPMIALTVIIAVSGCIAEGFQKTWNRFENETEKMFQAYKSSSCEDGIAVLNEYVAYIETLRTKKIIPEKTLVVCECVTKERLSRSYEWLGFHEKALGLQQVISNECLSISFPYRDITKLATNLNMEYQATNIWCFPISKPRETSMD